MSARAAIRPVALAALLALSALAPRTARAQEPAPAMPDTTLDAYIRRMADSTDAYFGRTAAPTDTAGLDSALAYGLEHPNAMPGPRVWRPQLSPWLGFSRADAAIMGGEVAVGRRRTIGLFVGRLAYANGPNDWLGGGEYRKLWLKPGTGRTWAFEAGGGRMSEPLNRDHHDPVLSAVRAFVLGNDRTDYVRRDGAHLSLQRETATWRANVALRDELESALPTTATWTLKGHGLDFEPNDQATFGRARELRLGGAARLQRLPITLEAAYWTSGPALGSDFNYRRTRAAIAGDFSLAKHVSVALQAEYGRLSGQMLPQAAFFLGGGSSIRSLDGNALRGSGKTLGRLDLILKDDLIKLLGFRGSPSFPIQLGAFAGSGAIWGREPLAGAYGAFDRVVPSSRDWPEAREWVSEAGVALLYRPGLPEPDTFIRFDYVIPIGSDDRESGIMISFQRPLNLVHPFR